MKKYIFIIMVLLILINTISCILLSDINEISSSKRNDDINCRVKVDIDNSANEAVYVNLVVNKGRKNERETTLRTIPIGRVATINIRKGSTIIIYGGNTNRKYFEAVCEIDFERIVVY